MWNIKRRICACVCPLCRSNSFDVQLSNLAWHASVCGDGKILYGVDPPQTIPRRSSELDACGIHSEKNDKWSFSFSSSFNVFTQSVRYILPSVSGRRHFRKRVASDLVAITFLSPTFAVIRISQSDCITATHTSCQMISFVDSSERGPYSVWLCVRSCTWLKN